MGGLRCLKHSEGISMLCFGCTGYATSPPIPRSSNSAPGAEFDGFYNWGILKRPWNAPHMYVLGLLWGQHSCPTGIIVFCYFINEWRFLANGRPPPFKTFRRYLHVVLWMQWICNYPPPTPFFKFCAGRRIWWILQLGHFTAPIRSITYACFGFTMRAALVPYWNHCILLIYRWMKIFGQREACAI